MESQPRSTQGGPVQGKPFAGKNENIVTQGGKGVGIAAQGKAPGGKDEDTAAHGKPFGGKDENIVYIGKKDVWSYVLAVVTQFNNGAPEVGIKARGKAINRAVDVAEVVRSRFMPDLKVKNISISTEEMPSEDGSLTKVSAIEIRLAR